MLKLFARTAAALALGLVFSLWIIQNSTTIKSLVNTKLIDFIQNEWNAHVDIDGIKINFFTFSCFIKNPKVKPNQANADTKKYAWQCDQCCVYVSPYNLLFKKKISLYLTFNNLKAQTAYQNGTADIVDHITDIFTPKSLESKISAKALTINNIELTVTTPQAESKDVTLYVPGTFYIGHDKQSSDTPSKSWQGALDVTNATIMHNNQPLCQELKGTVSFYKDKDDGYWYTTSYLQGLLPLLHPTTKYTLDGTWNWQQKQFTFKDQSNLTKIVAAFTDQSGIKLTGQIPLNVLTHVTQFAGTGAVQASSFIPKAHGGCNLDLLFSQRGNVITTTGTVACTDLNIGSLSVKNAALTFVPKNPSSKTTSSQTPLQGSFEWDLQQSTGSLSIINTTSLQNPSNNPTVTAYAPIMINPGDLAINVAYDTNAALKGTYRCTLTNHATEKKYPYMGALLLNKKYVGMKGKSVKGDYSVKVALTPQPHVTRWHYRIDKKDLINVTSSAQNPLKLEGSVRWAFLRSFLDKSLRRSVFNNNCCFNITLDQQDLQNLSGSIRMTEGRFFIPDYHNLIQTIKIDWGMNIAEKKLCLDNLAIGLSKGSITCPRATVTLNDDYSVNTIHAPLCIDNMFINWKQDFYGFLYGNLLLNKLPNTTTHLSGNTILKKSLLKDTFFAQESRSSFYGPMGSGGATSTLPLTLNINFSTEQPLRVKTPVINAFATVDLVIKSKAKKDFLQPPSVTGIINLNGGFLKFFHNKLNIDYGRIQFVSHLMNDPLVDLVAKNRIGKYLVTLQASGSLQKPNIVLESTPELAEEQILGLLLTGSDETTLQADLLSMFMQNLDSFIFDNKKHSKTTAWADRLSKTFKYVQITPNLSDDANPGKLKGSISLSLTDQLHAHIQKNFDLEKDFSAQLEYMLSDEINLKVVKDQHGELGSEVEMRLKLG